MISKTTLYPVFSYSVPETTENDYHHSYLKLAQAVLIRACRDVLAGDNEAASWLGSQTGGLMFGDALGIPGEAIFEWLENPVPFDKKTPKN